MYELTRSRRYRLPPDREVEAMAKPKKGHVSRRRFLTGAAVGTAALVARPSAMTTLHPAVRPGVVVPTEDQLRPDTGEPPTSSSPRIVEHPGSDFMVDVLK